MCVRGRGAGGNPTQTLTPLIIQDVGSSRSEASQGPLSVTAAVLLIHHNPSVLQNALLLPNTPEEMEGLFNEMQNVPQTVYVLGPVETRYQ